MIKNLKREFNKFFATQKEEVDMSKETVQEVSAKELVEAVTADTKLSDALAAATELNASQASALVDLTSKLEAAQAALAIIEADKASLVAQAAATKLEARKAQVVAAIGTDKAEALMAATAGMEDAQFEAVVGALAFSLEKEAEGPLFKEIGVSGEVDASKVEEDKPTHFKQFIKTK